MLQHFLEDIEAFATNNKMKINKSKTKVMKFSRAKSSDFPLEVAFADGQNLEVINEFKLLGVMVQNNLKWGKNTEYICKRARGKIWLLRNMKNSGLDQAELLDAYKKEVRSLVELAVPVWHAGITKQE